MNDQPDLKLTIDPDFSGCILVTRSGRSLMQQAYGEADRGNRVPNQLTTRFQTASAGKGFIAVGIMQLIASGQLCLTDMIGDLLELDWQTIDPAVTIQQLLTHTSGVPDYFDESKMTDYAELWQDLPNYRMRRQSDLVPLFIDQPMLYPPGERFQYNNSGFVLLGLVIEKLSSQLFDDYLRDRVFIPAGMTRTGYYELDALPDGCAQAYLYDSRRQAHVANIFSIEAKGSGAGGAFTTVSDMEQFWRHLLNGQLLPLPIVQDMIRQQAGRADDAYGFGFWLDQDASGAWAPRLEGSDPGVSFVSSYDPKRDLTVTVVSNRGQDVWAVRRQILDQSKDSRSAAAVETHSLPPDDPAAFQLMTERLMIRRFRPSDALDLYEYLSDETVVWYEPYEVYSLEQASQEAVSRAGDNSFYAVCLRENGKLIGNLYLGGSDFDTWEIGYVFNRHYQGKGYATESAKALLQYAFTRLGARRAIAGCALENHASWHLLERLGMRREGLQLQNIWFKRNSQGEPQWLDSCLYAILKSEWPQD